jgi:hypothetical protein
MNITYWPSQISVIKKSIFLPPKYICVQARFLLLLAAAGGVAGRASSSSPVVLSM